MPPGDLSKSALRLAQRASFHDLVALLTLSHRLGLAIFLSSLVSRLVRLIIDETALHSSSVPNLVGHVTVWPMSIDMAAPWRAFDHFGTVISLRRRFLGGKDTG